FPSYYHLAMCGWFGPSGDGHVATKWGSSGGAQTAAGGRTTRAIKPRAASSNTRVPPCKWLIAVTIANPRPLPGRLRPLSGHCCCSGRYPNRPRSGDTALKHSPREGYRRTVETPEVSKRQPFFRTSLGRLS